MPEEDFGVACDVFYLVVDNDMTSLGLVATGVLDGEVAVVVT
jgi:hypothetical protein